MNELIKQTPHIKRLNLLVTKHCNLHCRMCDYKEFTPSSRQELSFQLIKSIIKEFATLGGELLEISGGEPMARKEIYDIIADAYSAGLKTLMMTNGTLIGQPETEKLLRAGLNSVSVSLEGPEQLNDQLRGPGNFQKTINAIQCFLNHPAKQPDFEVFVGITLSKYNYKQIVSFSKFLLEEIGIHRISINPFSKWMLRGENFISRPVEFEISDDLLPDLSREIERLIEYAQSVPPIQLPSPNYLNKLPGYFKGEKFIPAQGCIIPSIFCAITADGWIFPCWQSPEPHDNINETNLTEFLSSRSYQEFREQALAGKCSGCLTSCFTEMH